jgi:hypothetical protein
MGMTLTASSKPCKTHPNTEALSCAICGKEACGSCGAFVKDEQALCAACGEHELRGVGMPIGTVLIAVCYLGLVAVLAVTKEVRPYLLGASALLAIGLARVFSTMKNLRRPTLTRDLARPLRTRPEPTAEEPKEGVL